MRMRAWIYAHDHLRVQPATALRPTARSETPWKMAISFEELAIAKIPS